MIFINKNWCYPGRVPSELIDLPSSAESFLSPISVFCELTNRRLFDEKSTRPGHHFVKGRIGIYKCSSFLGREAGTRGLISNQLKEKKKLSEDQIQCILVAYSWLKSNNYIYKDEPFFTEDERVDVGSFDSLTTSLSSLTTERNLEGGIWTFKNSQDTDNLRDKIFLPANDGLPSMTNQGNEHGLKDVIFGIDSQKRFVKYSNPRLLGYLFPTIYVKGKGFYSLSYDGIESGEIMETHESRITGSTYPNDGRCEDEVEPNPGFDDETLQGMWCMYSCFLMENVLIKIPVLFVQINFRHIKWVFKNHS